MRFYTKQHKFYCGIDLHTNKMYLCILNSAGETVLHRNMRTNPEVFLRAIKPYRDDIVVSAECMFSWYWIADLCEKENIPFILSPNEKKIEDNSESGKFIIKDPANNLIEFKFYKKSPLVLTP